jgi:FtsH-binding integral membrane protein
MEHAMKFLFGGFSAVMAIVGVFLASGAQDEGIYWFGALLFVFGIVLNFWLIKRHFDNKDASRLTVE